MRNNLVINDQYLYSIFTIVYRNYIVYYICLTVSYNTVETVFYHIVKKKTFLKSFANIDLSLAVVVHIHARY